MTSPQVPRSVEYALSALFTDPEEAFLDRLETTLLGRARLGSFLELPVAASTGKWPRLRQAFRRHRWAFISASLILAFALAIGLVGPQRVLAGARQLLSYITGVGFVETDGAYVLASPVVDERHGVTMHVEQVLAQPDRTVIVLSFEGLPPWAQEQYLYNTYLRLPDGKIVGPGPHQGHMVEWDYTVLEFPQLPTGVRTFSLVWTDKFNLRRVYDGGHGRWVEISEAWTIPIQLVPADDTELVSLGETYSLEAAGDTHFDITLQITEVAQYPDRTSLQVVLEWPESRTGRNGIVSTINEKLTDDSGRIYQQQALVHWDEQGQSLDILQIPGQGRLKRRWTYLFVPGALHARSLTFSANVMYRHSLSGIGFELDLGPDPMIGDSWPLDVELDIDGYRVHIQSGELVEVMGDEGKVIALALFTDPLTPQEGRQMIDFAFKVSGFWDLRGYIDLLPIGTQGTSPVIIPLALSGDGYPTGTVDIVVDSATFISQEVWEITWDTPPSSTGE